jgi:hypothetical protein
MRKILSMLALTVAVSFSAAAQNAPIHWYVDSTSTNILTHIWGNSVDSVKTGEAAYEGTTRMQFSFTLEDWWGGNGGFRLDGWGAYEKQDLTNHTYLEFAVKATGDVGAALKFAFTDSDEKNGDTLIAFTIDGDADYKIVRLPLSDFSVNYGIDLSSIDQLVWAIGNKETGSGVFYLDYIRLVDETTTSVKNKTLTELTVGPNPSNGIYKIESQERLDQVIVSDALGAVVKTVSVSGTSAEIDLTGKPEGIYYLRAIAGEKSSTTKVIKN